ncbi:DNA polymerase subunit delta-2 [Lecanosticta acicola]|uniref:DNA-directed DNA polymerase n=1 Tax=Lecanosticta acicola TaxID=111012 RepID=A0AAI8Z8T5_9PEZI|nr:DNA polymerase subunit delta-2 [Lecanosticta acicola]
MAISTPSGDDALLSKPTPDAHESLSRTHTTYAPLYTYTLPRGQAKHYQQQYADMYFARLAQLKPPLQQIASEAFSEFGIAGEYAQKVDRVLDVRQGELCWVIGTVYMEMPLKPNVLEDIGKEHWIAAPPAREKYTGEMEQMMLEDESGRLRMTGNFLRDCLLVTGAIVAVLGTENAEGEFDVLDLRVPDLPRQPERWEKEDGLAARKGGKVSGQQRSKGGKLALVSGLSMSGDQGDTLALDLLMEYLLGEATSAEEQSSAADISRLVIAGNSLSHSQPIPTREELAAARKGGRKTYGYDASAYNAAPTDRLDTWLASLLPSMPVTILPGATDPTSTSLPQQPIHAAMFPHSRAYMEHPVPQEADGANWFDATTNPSDLDIHGWRFLGAGGQTLDDVYRYVHGEERLEMMEAMLRWRLTAPTAPDTLWCYPFQDGDRFVMREAPHVYFVGNQPKFETSVIEGPQGQAVRLVAVPKFKETGEIVLMDLETLVPELVKIEVFEGS